MSRVALEDPVTVVAKRNCYDVVHTGCHNVDGLPDILGCEKILVLYAVLRGIYYPTRKTTDCRRKTIE